LRRQFRDQLAEEYTIDTPENVTFGYEVAGIGSRFVAAMLDNVILTVILVGLNVALVVALAAMAENSPPIEVQLAEVEEDWVAGALIAIYALLNFLIWWGYYLLFEWLWHGQTPGKRSARIRVVRADGAPLSFVPVAVRNLVRPVDFLPAGYALGVITMFCNRQSRRLGDFAAGTLVVKDQGEVTIQQLMAQIPKTAPTSLRTAEPTLATPDLPPDQDWSGIRRLNSADYELVQETLARHKGGQLDAALLRRVATAIATKLEGAPSSQLEKLTRATVAEQVAFLNDVATAYGRWVR
jgi:uncharacterized RDD family membrane protein YckC